MLASPKTWSLSAYKVFLSDKSLLLASSFVTLNEEEAESSPESLSYASVFDFRST
jgi:hypothetical protein